jgi:hypothetical protein
MKALFTAIRAGDVARVRELCESDPAVVNQVSGDEPKKDRGQSPLQVAVKTGHYEIADWLIAHGADVCFIEADGANDWRMPVLHDAIRAATFSASASTFDAALRTLGHLLDAGADPRAVDSYGNTAATRFALDVAQIWGPQLPEAHRSATREHLGRLRALLVRAGIEAADLIPPEPAARPYSARSKFAVDDRIAHPQLGEGRVCRLLPDGKIEVDFAVGIRVLVHGR